MTLFDQAHAERLAKEAPLAARMRPRTLDEYVGQEHIIGPGRLLRRAIQADQLGSLIFYGPPGTGKTTLARVIANTTRAHFIAINAVLSGVKEIREAIADAQEKAKLYTTSNLTPLSHCPLTCTLSALSFSGKISLQKRTTPSAPGFGSPGGSA